MTQRTPTPTLFPYTTLFRSGHGGADTSLHDLIFRGSQGSDPLGLRADLRAGARASLIGIAAYRSIEGGGKTIRIKDLVEDRKSTRLNSSHTVISYAVFCLKK